MRNQSTAAADAVEMDVGGRAPLCTNRQILDRYKGVISRDRYFKLKRRPDFPKPVLGGPNARQVYNLRDVDQFFASLTGEEVDE